MPTCSARGCRNRSRRGIKVTFHLFPKNLEMRQRWIPVTGRKNWTPGLRAVLCSDHFEEPCFDRTGQTTRLRAGAIPTIGKFAPKNKKNQIFIKLEPENEHQRHPENKAEPAKIGITTRSGRQLNGQMMATEAMRTLKKDPLEIEVEPDDVDDPPISEPTTETMGIGKSLADTPPSAHPDHFYCRTQNEMDALLKKSEQKIEFLKMKLDYLNSPSRTVKQEPPDWSQFRRVSMQKEAEHIKALVKAGSKPVKNDNSNAESLTESDEQLRERLREAEDLQRQIKTLQQKNRRLKKRSKAKFIRYVVMIEPTSKSGKKGTTASCNSVKEGEKEETVKETETPPVVEQVSSLHDSILSHTASMVVGPSGLLDEKDKQIKDLQKKLKIARQKEKRKMEQLEHLQEVIEMLKEKCPEYSNEKEPALQRYCSLCHSPLLKRCHRVAQNWAVHDITEGQVSVPLSQFKPAQCHSLPHSQLWSRNLRFRKSQLNNEYSLCPDCQSLVNKHKLKQRSLMMHSLRPHC